MKTCVAYYRTSSTNPKDVDSDSRPRQQEACQAYAKANGLEIVNEYYDPGVSGTAAIHERPAFAEMITYMLGNGARIILVENASRFARDLAVQLAGHDWLKSQGIQLIPVDAPDHFVEETPTAVLVRQVLGAVNQFAKAEAVARMHRGRRKKIAETGWAGGQPQVPQEVIQAARRLARKNSKGQRRSLRAIGEELAKLGHLGVKGKPYGPESVKRMLGKATTK